MSANQIMIIQPIINKNTQLGNKYFENVYRQYRKSNFAFKQRNGDMESQFNFTNELTSWFNDIENNIRRKNNKYRKFQYSIRSITVFQLFKDLIIDRHKNDIIEFFKWDLQVFLLKQREGLTPALDHLGDMKRDFDSLTNNHFKEFERFKSLVLNQESNTEQLAEKIRIQFSREPKIIQDT